MPIGSSSIPLDRASDYFVASFLEWPAAAAHGWLSAVDLGRRNAKGDEVKDFDLAADRAIVEYLESLAVPLVLETEEASSRNIGSRPPEWLLIADPVDGSDNWIWGESFT